MSKVIIVFSSPFFHCQVQPFKLFFKVMMNNAITIKIAGLLNNVYPCIFVIEREKNPIGINIQIPRVISFGCLF